MITQEEQRKLRKNNNTQKQQMIKDYCWEQKELLKFARSNMNSKEILQQKQQQQLAARICQISK